MELTSITEEGTENLTGNSDTVNITGHTAVISNIEHLGNKPENWLLALQQLEQIENGPRKRKVINYFYIQSGKILRSAVLSNNRSYAVLLGKEALFQGEVDAENARSAFEMALTICRKSSVIYIMFAQFELNQGRSSKALKILKHGELCVTDAKEILSARTKLEKGCTVIDETIMPKNISPLQNITNKQQLTSSISVTKSNFLAASPQMKQNNKIFQTEPHPSPQAPPHVLETFLTLKTPEPPITPNHLKFGNNFDFQSRAVQTPPPLKITAMCKALHLGLDLQSPASPDLSFMSSKKSFCTRSNLTSDNTSACATQSRMDSANNISTTTSGNSARLVAASSQSEKKFSPVSRIKKMICQTTGKMPSCAQPKRVSRRVLIKDANTSRWSDSDSDSNDIKPIKKSPNNADLKVLSKATNDEKEIKRTPISSDLKNAEIDNNKENVKEMTPNVSAFHSYTHSNKQEGHVPMSQPPRHPDQSRFPNPANKKSPPSRPEQSHLSNYSGLDRKLNFVQDFDNRQRVREIPPTEACQQSTLVQSRHPSTNHQMQGHHPYFQHDQNQASYAQPHHPAQYNIHPAFRKFQEKKIIEINGVAYILLKILGKGGSSKVYQVINPLTSEISAVKQVNLAGCESSVLEGYKNEIEFLKRLQGNRYIIKLIDYEVRENHLYLVMECGSLDLSGFLKKQKAENEKLEMIDILVFWKNMLKAVETIHKHGVIHLDLKPANFMLVDYTLKLIDFGIANSIQVDATSIIKDTQFGTLNYMAPETINDMSGGVQTGSAYTPKFKVGPKADVWSLGCILYYIMYGKTPFQHIHHQGMKLFAITNENHKIEFPDFLRRELIEIVQACLIRDPKKRPSVEMLLNHPLLK